jgi:predicted nucleic acid-binding protein
VKVFIDANVWLDVALQRAGLMESSQSALILCDQQGDERWVAWHTISNIFYIVRRYEGRARAELYVKDLLASTTVATVGHAEALRAAELPMNDFEDAMQIAAAEACTADAIVTRNVQDFSSCTIPVYTPEDFVKAFKPPASAP